MNKEKVINFAGSTVIFFLLLFAYSKWGPALPITVSTQQKGDPFVVTGEGKVTVVPDIAKITLGVEESGQSLEQVQDSINQTSKDLMDELKKLGIDEKDIKTTSYNVYPNYDYESPTRKITGYRVSSNYQVKVLDIEKINDVITTATSLGINSVGGISFEVNDETKKDKLQEARDLAVSEAKEKAKGLASASGITLGKIINVSESENGVVPRPLYDSKEIAIGSSEAVQPDIQPGQTEISILVSLSYEVR